MIAIAALIAAVIGLLVGGVINVLADDLPVPTKPRLPHDPDGAPRPRSAWLGVSAFLTHQRHGLSWRHPIVEIVMALSYLGMTLRFQDEKNLPYWYVYVAIMMLITVIDLEHRLILRVVILPACLFALFVAVVSPIQDKPFTDFLIGGALGFGLFFIMFAGGLIFSAAKNLNEVAFGFGDVMLATFCGLVLGWRSFMFAAFITVFAGAAGAILYLLVRALMGRRYEWFTPLPYGPYVVFGTLVMLMFRSEVADFLWTSYK
jgi:leader peptidase (prepilin peptidase)/N-methyltransferase